MRRVILPALLWFTPAFAQTAAPAPAPDPVPALPGAGRAIPVEAVRARRTALTQRVGRGVVVVPAARPRDLEVEVLQDNDFRQDDYFFYLTGLEAPDAWLVLGPGTAGGWVAHLFLPERDLRAEVWTGRTLGPGDEARRLTGIDSVHAVDRLDESVDRLLAASGGPLHLPLYHGTEGLGRIRAWSRERQAVTVRNVVPVLDSLRLVKDQAETASLRRAVEITVAGLRDAMRSLRPGMFEYEVEAVIEYAFRRLGADRVGFPSIVGSGPNSTTLHYDESRRRIAEGDLVVMDVGAEYGQYTADVTRTVPASGRFTPRQARVYDLVLGAQQAAIDAVRPGVTVAALTQIARAYLREHSGDLCGGSSCERYFLHGLGHWLGMRVHDVGDYDVALAPGMVLTIEPGLYIADEQLGVRIEDDILVTASGAEVLSAGVPRTVEAIEALMRDRAPIP